VELDKRALRGEGREDMVDSFLLEKQLKAAEETIKTNLITKNS
jgi:hypothetical protein